MSGGPYSYDRIAAGVTRCPDCHSLAADCQRWRASGKRGCCPDCSNPNHPWEPISATVAAHHNRYPPKD